MNKILAFLTLLSMLPFAGSADAEKPAGKLVYTWNGSLYVADITAAGAFQAGTRPREIMHRPRGSEEYTPTVSAAGTMILICIRSGEADNRAASLWAVADVAGAQPRRLGLGSQPCFAPTGKQFVYTTSDIAGGSSVCIWDLATGKRRVLRPWAYSPYWCGNDKEIALIDASKSNGTRTVMVVDTASGQHLRYRNDGGNIRSPQVSPNGRYVAYTTHMSRPKPPGTIADVQTRDEVELPFETGSLLGWSADGKWLLWTRVIIDPHNTGVSLWEQIWVTDLSGSRSHRIGTGTWGRFAPDGRHVIYRTEATEQERPSGLYVADM